VILVSVDGLRADILANLMADDTVGDFANFQRLVDEGATTFNARTDYTHTLTIPNHTCMLTSRPVSQPAGQPNTVHHGYTANTDPQPGDTLHNSGNPNVDYVASAFDVAHDYGLSTALFASKSKFILFDQSYDTLAGAPDHIAPDHGPDKIDTYTYLRTGPSLSTWPPPPVGSPSSTIGTRTARATPRAGAAASGTMRSRALMIIWETF